MKSEAEAVSELLAIIEASKKAPKGKRQIETHPHARIPAETEAEIPPAKHRVDPHPAATARDKEIWALEKAGVPHALGRPSRPDPDATARKAPSEEELAARLEYLTTRGTLKEIYDATGIDPWDREKAVKSWKERAAKGPQPKEDELPEWATYGARGPTMEEQAAEAQRVLAGLYERSTKAMVGHEKAKLAEEIREAERTVFELEGKES